MGNAGLNISNGYENHSYDGLSCYSWNEMVGRNQPYNF